MQSSWPPLHPVCSLSHRGVPSIDSSAASSKSCQTVSIGTSIWRSCCCRCPVCLCYRHLARETDRLSLSLFSSAAAFCSSTSAKTRPSSSSHPTSMILFNARQPCAGNSLPTLIQNQVKRIATRRKKTEKRWRVLRLHRHQQRGGCDKGGRGGMKSDAVQYSSAIKTRRIGIFCRQQQPSVSQNTRLLDERVSSREETRRR